MIPLRNSLKRSVKYLYPLLAPHAGVKRLWHREYKMYACKHLYEIEICTSAKELTVCMCSILLNVKFRNETNVNTSPDFSSGTQKMSLDNEVVWLI